MPGFGLFVAVSFYIPSAPRPIPTRYPSPPPVCTRFLPFTFIWLNRERKTCFSASTYFFPDGTKRNFKRSKKDPPGPRHPPWPGRPPIPGQQRGGGFPGFLPPSPALTFLAGLLGRSGHVPSRGRTGGGAQAGVARGTGAAPGLAKGIPGERLPASRGTRPARAGARRVASSRQGSRRGAGFPRLCKEVAAAATSLARRGGVRGSAMAGMCGTRGSLSAHTLLFDLPPALLGELCAILDSCDGPLGWRGLGECDPDLPVLPTNPETPPLAPFPSLTLWALLDQVGGIGKVRYGEGILLHSVCHGRVNMQMVIICE